MQFISIIKSKLKNKIYIEIPNSFENYLTKFGILNAFNIENIVLGESNEKEISNSARIRNVPMLPLELEPEIRNKFNKLNEFNDDKEIEKFIKDNFNSIGIKEYSYHQVHIFIKIYTSQFNTFKSKLTLKNTQNKNITDECIEYFAKNTKYFINGGFAKLIMQKKSIKNIFELCLDAYESDLSKEKFETKSIEIFDFDRKNETVVSENLVMQAANQVINSSYKYLKRLKQILYLPNDLEKDIDDKKSLLSILEKGITDNYVITEDNYKKMVLLVYRIKANVPVIIMGETGCGKTSLIIKLSQILNNGEELVEKIDIHPGITDEEINEKMKEMNKKAKSDKYKNKELWVFFDEINTCLSFSLLTEIFINKTFNGEKLEDNIRLIGACNPYRKRKELIERCGLTREDDEDDQLVYKVEQLPQSLLYYVFSFGSLRDDDEKKYIRSIIQKLFTKEEENLRDLTTKVISKCHIFLRRYFGNDPSIVSLREIARFKTCVEFFLDYFSKKEKFIYENKIKKHSKDDEPKSNFEIDDETKKLFKIKNIICSFYLCYFIRLTNEEIRFTFDA